MHSDAKAYALSSPAQGDVILCRGHGKGSRWNVAAQQLLRWGRPVRHSHVALQLNNIVVHAMPGKGVHAVPMTTFFHQSGLKDDWQVFRHRSMDIADGEESATAGAQVYQRAQFFVGQTYNARFLIPKVHRFFARVDESSFCSELVCHVYEGTDARATIRRRSATAVLPADIERAVTTSDQWVEVTDIYRARANDVVQGGAAQLQQRIDSELPMAREFENFALLLSRMAATSVAAATTLDQFSILDGQLRRKLGMARRAPPAALDGVETLGRMHWKIARDLAQARQQLAKSQRAAQRAAVRKPSGPG